MRRISLLLGLCLSCFVLQATHYRAGEIRVEQIGDCNELRIRATIITYTKESRPDADRQELTLCWGDGTCSIVPRVNGPLNRGESIGNDIKVNRYVEEHVYPGRSTYTLTMTDPNRIGNILNVNAPFSVNTPFHLNTTYTFLNPQFQGCNSTPELLQPPIDIACLGQPFQHNPNAFDPDGDSLSYTLTVPFEDVGRRVGRYLFPNDIMPGADNNLTMDPITGDILWDAPQRAGDYVIAMYIIEWRNGIPIDTTLRDLQVSVFECENLPPELEVPIEEVCVIAGEVIEFDVVATAPLVEVDQLVQLQAFGGPLEIDVAPATFERNNRDYEEQPVTKRFRWETQCEHISDQFYSIVFKAADNFQTDTVGLATLKTVRIKVVGPPPEDVQAEVDRQEVSLTWAKPYACEVTENEYFRGFSVWRREGSNPFPIDSCEGGLEGRGYERLTFDHLEMNAAGDRYEYIDRGLARGKTYCYRILAEFARLSPSGQFPYNRVASLPSEELCLQLGKDVPLITNVNVLETDAAQGRIEIAWSKPEVEDLDTLQNPAPYRYVLLRATGIGGTDFEEVVTQESESFAAANDTMFIDENLNTTQVAYTYKVEFYVENNQLLGETQPASSIFLSSSPTDRACQLSWQEDVPWINIEYVVYQILDGDRIPLDTVNVSSYTHTGLENGEIYEYVVRGIGSYGVPNIKDPLINDSQEITCVPLDNVPPCTPELTVANICNEEDLLFDIGLLDNLLIWTQGSDCTEPEPVAEYRIYYAPIEGEALTFIGTTTSELDTFFIDQPGESIAGCYAVSAVDANGNESPQSNIVCVDNCPDYTLPNTFTPNGDGANDQFIPYPYRFIERVEFQVYNRWGQLVFETDNPDLNWNGQNFSGEDLAAGTYYYTCVVFEQRVVGIVQRDEVLSGWIQLVR
ncbi:MAG: gliding motility-associated C-terminal domain-containing protein [Bacteroidota bacterium]